MSDLKFNELDPSTDADLDGVTDPAIAKLYRVSRNAYPHAPVGIKVALNSIMTVVATMKPTKADLATRSVSELRLWYDAIKSCASIVEVGVLPYLGSAETLLEELLGINDNELDSVVD